MTGLLDQLRNLVAALPSIPGGPWIVLGDYVEHKGLVAHVMSEDDEDCDCDEHAGPLGIGYQLPATELRELLEQVAHFRGNGATDEQAADHGMATLMLRSIESGGTA